jgi:glutamyl-tRNA synthetase
LKEVRVGASSVEPVTTHVSPSAGGVVTRFAPSPTGYLHIGGARTALFNWLYAKRTGGKFLLRIEDTDRARSTEPAIAAILDGMRWLGLHWDGDEIYQFARASRHAEVAFRLLEHGRAYKCFATAEELTAMREQQRAAKLPLRYDGRWRNRDPEEAPEGAPFVVRLKAETEGETVIEDAVQGRVAVRNGELDDMVLLRSDGTPTYMLAVVVDDHDMGVTHVIRGDDHLNNAFRQLGIYRAMAEIDGGWAQPIYAHVPLIHGGDGAKLSKRHGALGVDAYRDELGILPEALDNYLLRLGWGRGDEDIVPRERAVEIFDLGDIGRSPARFDAKKLEHLNGHYIRQADDERLALLATPILAETLGRPLTMDEHRLLARAMPVLKVRARDTRELARSATFLFDERPLDIEPGAEALLQGNGATLLAAASLALGRAEWTAGALDVAVRGVAEEAGVGLGKVAQPLRAALTGRTTSPGIFDVLLLVGRDESLARIADRLAAD